MKEDIKTLRRNVLISVGMTLIVLIDSRNLALQSNTQKILLGLVLVLLVALDVRVIWKLVKYKDNQE